MTPIKEISKTKNLGIMQYPTKEDYEIEGFDSCSLTTTMEVMAFGQHLVDFFGLEEKGWRFEFNYSKRAFGQCKISERKICISKPIVKINFDNVWEIKDTILHEIAHAINFELGTDDGHGENWKKIARDIGAMDTRCFSESKINMPDAKYILRCPNCKREVRRYYRKPKLPRSCPHCDNKWNPKYKLELIKLGKKGVNKKEMA